MDCRRINCRLARRSGDGGGGYGLVGDIVLGIVGGLVGGYLAGALFGVADAVNGINVLSIVVAFIGAMILIGLSRMFLHPRRA